ncbi:MAG: trypsin-like peptidase domain-containing protein [Chloroflexi bacterium]|nr:trypsin-like peptidase domain-containing protein [Chloroflexota bacterium]
MKTLSSEMASSLLVLSNDLADAVERVGRAVVTVNARKRIPSSGVHWRQDVVVTAAHTVEHDDEITVTLSGGRTIPATLAGRDTGTDLAVLKPQGIEIPTAEPGDASLLKVGHLVLAVGYGGEGGPSASLGIISTLSGAWRTWRGGQIDQFVRPDLTLYPGFSGGPLVDARGGVIGINTLGLSRNMGLTIPTSTVNRVTDKLLEKGRITRGFLGLGMYRVHLPDTLRGKLNLPGQGGVIVLSVELDGPSDKAGLLIGDVLVALDGTLVNDIHDVQGVLEPEYVGKTISASIIRGGALAELVITVGERPRGNR